MKLRLSSSRLVEVSGPRADFSAWAQALRQERGAMPMDTGGGVIRCETVPTGKVAISWTASPKELRIRGGAEGMDYLAEGVEGFALDGEEGTPWHIDSFSYLAANAMPVVCVLVD